MSRPLLPYFDTDGAPLMERSVVVVADVLGFSAMVREAFRNKGERELLMKIHGAIEKARQNVSDPSGMKWFTKLFTDNIVVGYPSIGPGDVAFEFPQACHSIGHFQREMAMEGFLVRGGLVVDQIHMSDGLIYGKVLDELHEAERRAHYPRIVLLDSSRKYLATLTNSPAHRHIVWRDECDGAFFINYLYPLGTMNDRPRENEITRHKLLIESGISRFQGVDRILQKYEWLARYHNRFCHGSAHWNSDRYCIDER